MKVKTKFAINIILLAYKWIEPEYKTDIFISNLLKTKKGECMSKSDEKRGRLEKAYKVASRHYQRCLADLAEARYNESNAKYALLINGGYEWEYLAEKRHVKAENKRKKIEERFKQYESIHLSALIKLQDYMESIGEPVV